MSSSDPRISPAARLLLLGLLLALALVPGACTRGSTAAAQPVDSKAALLTRLARSGIAPEMYWDYGTVDLGTVVAHDFVLPIPDKGAADWIAAPDSFSGDCSCAIGTVKIKFANGTTRVAYGLPARERRLGPGDQVILNLVLDTREKEPADLARTLSFGNLSFQFITGQYQKAQACRLAFHYGLRTPVKVSPTAHLDFGSVPLSLVGHHRLVLRNNIPGQTYTLGRVGADVPGVTGKLIAQDDHHVLEVEIKPDEESLGPIRGQLVIGTDLKNLPSLRIPISGRFIPDIAIIGSPLISWNFHDFSKTRTDTLNIVDHNLNRSRGFVVHSLVDQASGDDLRKHFDVSFQELSGRTMRLHLKYLGTLGGKVIRARLRLAKSKDGEAVTTIALVGHNRSAD